MCKSHPKLLLCTTCQSCKKTVSKLKWWSFKNKSCLHDHIKHRLSKSIDISSEFVMKVGHKKVKFSLKRNLWGKNLGFAKDFSMIVFNCLELLAFRKLYNQSNLSVNKQLCCSHLVAYFSSPDCDHGECLICRYAAENDAFSAGGILPNFRKTLSLGPCL